MLLEGLRRTPVGCGKIWTVHWVKVERGIVSVALILLLLNKPTLTQHGLLLVYIVFWSHVASRRGEVLAY